MPNGEKASSLRWDLPNSRRFDFLQLKGRVRVEDIKKGLNPWNIARCLLYFQDLRGTRRWDYPHSAEGLSGSSLWVEFSKVFPVPDFAESAHVLIQNSAKSGTMWIDDISLQPLRMNHQFFRNRNILLGVGAILILVFLFIMKIWEGFGWMIPAIILVGALGVLCRQAYFEEIASVLSIKVEVLKKIGHFIIFLAMGTSSSLWLRRRSNARGRIGKSIYHAMCLFASLALFAAVTEFLQLLTLDRTPRLTDYLIDLSGSLLGVLLGFTMTRTCRTRFSKP
ncbi:MAG: VanZ family protein [Deltaproteobacteria bacterium]|nr:VanZ family protein [Deltaproteobacteria bacterium]